MDTRLQSLTRWLRQLDGFGEAEPQPVSGDASFRRYFRVWRQQPGQPRQPYIVMDAPPEHEDCRPFVAIARALARRRHRRACNRGRGSEPGIPVAGRLRRSSDAGGADRRQCRPAVHRSPDGAGGDSAVGAAGRLPAAPLRCRVAGPGDGAVSGLATEPAPGPVVGQRRALPAGHHLRLSQGKRPGPARGHRAPGLPFP